MNLYLKKTNLADRATTPATEETDEEGDDDSNNEGNGDGISTVEGAIGNTVGGILNKVWIESTEKNPDNKGDYDKPKEKGSSRISIIFIVMSERVHFNKLKNLYLFFLKIQKKNFKLNKDI